MENEVRVRRATRADRAHVLALHRALYIDHREQVLDEATAPFYAYRDMNRALEDDVDALLTNRSSFVLLAVREDAVLGYVTGHIEDDDRRLLPRRGVVEDWYVIPKERGKRVGALLLEMLLDIWKGLGCEVAESSTWKSNPNAIHAHESLGFQITEVKLRRRL